MTAGRAGGELHVGLALFKDAHHGVVALDAADGIPDDGAALVADQEGLDAPAAQLVDDLGGTGAAHLLGTGGGQIHILFGGVTGGQQFFTGLEKGHDRSLGVSSTPAPDLAVGNVAREGLMEPFALGGYHVLVAHEDDGLVMLFALPVKEQVAVDLGLFQPFMYQREQVFQHLVEAQELFNLGIVGAGHRFTADHIGQLLGVALGSGIGLRLIGGHFLGHEQGSDNGHGQQQQNQRQKGQNGIEAPDHLALPFLCSRKATPMAMAPEGNTMKLVEPVREGTSTNSRAMVSRGRTAIFMLPR